MPTVTSTFKNGNGEAVWLPRCVAFGADVQVTIVRSGDVLTIYPTRPPIQYLINRLKALPTPTVIELRDDEPSPERTGL